MIAAPRPSLRRLGALGVAVALVATSCMFKGDDKGQETVQTAALGPTPVESGLPADAKPTRGGQLVYGLEAESSGGWCLPEAQLAISGMQVARALYDTLTVPDAKGDYVPYLAKTITHDDSYRSWTITLRGGVTFHDGTKLDAEVVKNNLDAYRGAYAKRSPLLFVFVFKNIESVEVVNELSLTVKTKVPWVAFPAALYNSGRIGIVAQAQLDASEADCTNRPIGTGPFSFVSWQPEVSLRVKRNPDYWQQAPDGKPYPYLDAIDFRPMPNSDERIADLQQGELNMMHTSTASDMADNLARLRDDGAINLIVSEDRTETSYLMMNTADERLATRDVRLAITHAIDPAKVNELANKGFATLAKGPFAPEVLGYLDDPGTAGFDLPAAEKGVAAMEAADLSTRFSLLTSAGPAAIRSAGIQKEMLEAAGFTIDLEVESEAGLIERVIAGDYELVAFRNQPGEDPDANYNWWYGKGNPVNFGRFDDPTINAALDKGRTSPDPKARKAAYEAVNRQFAKQAYNVYLWYAPWAVAESPDVHGILGPPLPDEPDADPPTRLVTGHPLLGIWIDHD
ncbi:MAG: ABC transporter substrate-binding protein [Acidimicrobiales bacterium]